MIQVMGIDHVVLIAADVERTVQWYADKLGLVPERLAEWREGTVRFASSVPRPSSTCSLATGPA